MAAACALDELWHPAAATALERALHPAGHGPNSSSLFRPQAAVVAVAYSAENLFLFAAQKNLRIFLSCFFTGRGRGGKRHLLLSACGRRAATSDWRNPKKRLRDLHAEQAGISSFLGWSLLLWDYQPPPLEYALHGKQHAKRRAAHWAARLLCYLGYLYQPRVTSWILEEANSKGQTVFHS